MAPDLIYIAVCCYAMTILGVQGTDENARNSLLIIATGLHALYRIFGGAVALPVDMVTLTVGLFGAWIAMSLLWTDTKKSTMEAATWLCYLYLFTVCRQYPLDLLCWAVFPVGAILSALQIYRWAMGRPLMFAEYARNSNHNAAYLVIVTLVGLWISLNISPAVFPLTLIAGAAVGMSRARSGGIALIAGLLALHTIYNGIFAGIWLAGALAAATLIIVEHTSPANKKRSFLKRFMLCLAALKMIARRPFQGWGLNMYRKLLADYYNDQPAQSWIAAVDKAAGGKDGNTSHRVHNDHLEIMVELGLVGYALFLAIFAFMPASPFFFGFLIAYGVIALAFFPLREVHTAVPFWVTIGAIAGGNLAVVEIPLIAQFGLATLVICAMAMAVKILISLAYFDCAMRAKTEDEKSALLKTALLFDAYNTTFLATEAALNWQNNPFAMQEYIAKALRYYDGSVKKWELEKQQEAVLKRLHLGEGVELNG